MTQHDKDFSYGSRERQTATKFEDIRSDHSLRYQMVPLVSPELMPHKPTAILDVFCGNGYGTWFLAKQFTCSIFGIDGSAEAIAVANQHFSLPNNFFSSKIFPFNLPEAAYDIITCFESIEHIDNPEDFFASMVKSLKPNGLLYVSTPNEKVLPLELNKNWFNHHTKHFTDEEMIALGNQHGLSLQIRCGQNVYQSNDSRVVGVDENAAIIPNIELENPQFFIHIYQKPAATKVIATNSGTDNYSKGIIAPNLLKTNIIKLDVGCGEDGPQQGFIGVDIRQAHPNIAILSDTWSIGQFIEPNSVDEFYSRHTLEHITFAQMDKTLNSWISLLKKGGRVRIMIPDLSYHIHQFLDPDYKSPSPVNPDLTQRQHALAGFFGWQREGDTKLWDVHKAGYTFEILSEALTRAGFINIKRLDNQPWHLDVEAFKP